MAKHSYGKARREREKLKQNGIYKYHALLSPFTLQAFEDGPDRGFRNVGQYKPDAGETPKS
jgi:hypothetical protein